MYDWYSRSRGFDSPVRQHSFMEIGHKIISTSIISLPLIQVGQLLAKGCAHNTVQEKCGLRLTDCLDMTLVVHWDVK